jgi:hypothetical protein
MASELSHVRRSDSTERNCLSNGILRNRRDYLGNVRFAWAAIPYVGDRELG